jgi:hypothetical protein
LWVSVIDSIYGVGVFDSVSRSVGYGVSRSICKTISDLHTSNIIQGEAFKKRWVEVILPVFGRMFGLVISI